MTGRHGYRTVGNTALACRWEDGDAAPAVIDFDIARRSYAARKRLAQRDAPRQPRAPRATAPAGRVAPRQHENPRPTLRDIAVEEYHPDRGIAQMLGETAAEIEALVKTHPLVQQLRHGDFSGKEPQRTPGRQLLASGALCMAIASTLIIAVC